MKMSLLISSVIVFLLGLQTIEANNLITGTVYDESQQVIPGVSVYEKGTSNNVITNLNGEYLISVCSDNAQLVFSFIGFETQEVDVKGKGKVDVVLNGDEVALEECLVVGYGVCKKENLSDAMRVSSGRVNGIMVKGKSSKAKYYCPVPPSFQDKEDYEGTNENIFFNPADDPLSTFSVDVDKASYSNIRRFINNGSLPPVDAVRIEEMINYFYYNYEGPDNKHPFAVHNEVALCPWNKGHYLMKVALQGKKIKTSNLPASNLVFLLDVSGSMNASNKLPLLKSALKMLVNELRAKDKVSIVVYAGAAGVVLEPTGGDNKGAIINALDKLSAGGSTAGGEGLRLAYKLAQENFVKNGNNRIILATDGDFNVGDSSNQSMELLIQHERDKGVYITVAGFGMGNYKDSKMELIADKGNGNYFYIDNIQEARKALVREFGGTLYTIAKDVKFQLEFNPQHVAAYRLIGYENRLLNKEDFNNDKKDAGEIGAGHTVTALYEIIPVGAKDVNSYLAAGVDPLKYQKNKIEKVEYKDLNYTDELLTIKLRYKKPNEASSNLIVVPVKNVIKNNHNISDDFRFASAVAAWGMKLKNSEFIEEVSYEEIISWAENSKAKDQDGYRSEMIRLMESAKGFSAMLTNRSVCDSVEF